jgi:hypothetical protein
MPGSRALVLAALAGALLAGCGSSEEKAADPVSAVKSSVRDKVRDAQSVDAATFPKPAGASLEQFASQFNTDGPQAVAASSVFTPKSARLAFGLLDDQLHFVYGKTVVYLQRRGGGQISGPFAAPADVLVTEPKYRSRQAASEKDPFAAIYAAQVPIPAAGIWNALAVSELQDGSRVAALMSFQATTKAKDAIPEVGDRAPAVQTDTPASLKGNTDLLDTRIPPALELTRTSFADVVGKKPVALLFATPQLCQSRVCGPVVDEMLQLKAKYGNRMTFIHQEVYADNDPNKGLRKPLQAYHLPTEPGLFTVRADGTIAARLEGSIGLRAFENAIKAAL